jgi:hypothetical protein
MTPRPNAGSVAEAFVQEASDWLSLPGQPSGRGGRGAHRTEEAMISWIVRGLLAAGGVVAGLFVAKDAPNFGVVQMVMALMLLTFVVAVIAFWPARWTIALNRLQKTK